MASTDEIDQNQQPTAPPVPPAAPPHRPGPARMPGWLPRAMLLALVFYGCFQLGSWAFYQLIGLLTNIVIAFFLALAVEPAVGRMADRGRAAGSRPSWCSWRC